MHNITIGRYNGAEGTATRVRCDERGNELSRESFKAHAGWIEGVRDDGSTWIMYLDGSGSPECFWPRRESDGAVIGDPVRLD
ncbi:hypothetical protein NONO_c60490 [Nocardia nova SH22a]|uniref:Uncharacterized protein n=1 Tax=Nocardia nova SH22a TaxID=1415166 RepID=W5TNA3_9NOCA|nr:hypothetical protein [Nocardia nova]AHH20825.1 hypothetical protein NONO_c60490 [Nocardia nova SH22a]